MGDLPDWCSVPEGDWRIWAIVGGYPSQRNEAAAHWFWGELVTELAACAALRAWFGHTGLVRPHPNTLPRWDHNSGYLHAVVLQDVDLWPDDMIAEGLRQIDEDKGKIVITAQELMVKFPGWQVAISRSGLYCTIAGPEYRGYIHGGMSSIGLTRAISREAVDASLTRDLGL